MDDAPQTPAPAPSEEGAERQGKLPPDPDTRHATPDWRVDGTTEDDPRKGR